MSDIKNVPESKTARSKAEPELRFSEFNDKWQVYQLGELGSFFSGGTPTSTDKNFYSGNIPFIGSGKIGAPSVEQFITEKALNNSAAKMVEVGDLLYALYGATSGEVAISKINGAINQAVLCIRTDQNKFFLKSWLEKNKEKILKTYLQGGQGNLSGQIVKNFKLKLPAIEEQQKIADFLSSVDKKIEQLTEKHRLLTEYKKGTMQQIFSQQIRFKDDNGNDYPEWEEKALGDICIKKSSTISANAIEDSKGVFKMYGASGALEPVDFYDEENPYVAIVKDGAGVGRVQYCEAKSSVLGTLDKILPVDGVQLTFLYEVLKGISFEKYTTGSTIPHIYFKDYKKELIGLPTSKEQQKIASFLTEIDHKIDQAWSTLEQAKAFKKGLLQQMFV